MEYRILPFSPQMSSTGSHLLKEFANTGTPILDSLVRESIQNSLDAAKAATKHVKINFFTGTFEKNELFNQCNKLGDWLSPKFPRIPNTYLCFRDYNTEGLTGDVDDTGNQIKGNYYKLVNAIGDPQTDFGAGGSCGVGKTLYFRLGIKGFVIYYSRIQINDGNYESRLIAMMIENEKNDDSIIPPAIYGRSKSGICYWGIPKSDTTLPITDVNEIARFLAIFKIEPYKDEETGTTVILPFIDENKVLTDNQKIYEEGRTRITPYWHNSIDNYLKISIQRWYFARLNNTHYKKGPQLIGEINGNRINNDDMSPCFKIFQALYNRAIGCNEDNLNDILSGNENVKTETILLKNYKPLANNKSGTLAYIKADLKLLGMLPPTNCVSPFIFCNTNIDADDSNTPIIGYCRKPGMIVNYETVGDWLKRVPNTEKDSYLLAIFVLNSNNSLGIHSDLEEYVRKMEPNDHMEWVDGTYNNETYRFIRFIKNNVSKALGQFLSKDEQPNTRKVISELGRIYSWILPPEDFGKRPSASPRKSKHDMGLTRSHRKMKYGIVSQKLTSESIEVTYSFEASTPKDGFKMELLVSTSDGKNISLEDWNDMGLNIPFYISKAHIFTKKIDGNDCSKCFPLMAQKSKFEDKQLGLNLELIKTPNDSLPFALELNFDVESSFKIDVKLTINILSRDALPTIKIE